VTVHRVLVTGASGFVGTHLLPALRLAFPDAEITGTSTRDHPHLATLDVTSAAAVTALVEATRPDACIHLAAISAIPAARQDPDRTWRVNLHGTLNVARAMLAVVPQSTLVFSSSAEIYGTSFASGLKLDESALLAPRNTYAASKAAADLALGALGADGLRAIRLRLFNHTGAGQSDAFVVAAFARQIARVEAGQQPPAIKVGALESWRDFLDVQDAVAAYIACLRAAETLPPQEVLNIASGTPRRIGDILSGLMALSGVSATVESAAALLRPGDIPMAIGDAGKAAAALDWAPRVPWAETLQRVLTDWRARVRA